LAEDDETNTEDGDETHTEGDDETHSEDDDETHSEDEDEEINKLEDEEDDEIENAYKRELEVQVEAKQLEIKSELRVGEQKDKFEIKFQTDDEPEIEFSYKTESDSLEVKLKYKVEFEDIIEYVENDTVNLGYQDGEEISIYKLEDQEWNDLLHEITPVNGEEIHTFTASTTDGVFSLIMKISGALFTLENNAMLTPNSLKVDVKISNFPYTSETSSLALKTKIKTETETEVEEDTDEEGVGFASNEAQVALGVVGESQGFFSWAENATADGSEIDVLSSSLQEVAVDDEDHDEDLDENETSEKLYFSFVAVNASDIVWDPKVGVVDARASSDGSSIPGYGIWLAIIATVIAQISVVRLRRKN
jgi:hypothetical protein